MTEPGATMVIDGHTVAELLGRGGHGRVYRGQTVEGQECAIKVFRGLVDLTPMEERRFIREFTLARDFQHPNIVQVYGCGTTEGVPYFTMELVSGGHLRDIIDRHGGPGPHWIERPDLREHLLLLVDGILAGLGYIHARGIVHRDLKPENILVTADYQTKLMDFGLAKELGTSQRITETNTIVGTAAYLSPEQVTSTEVDPRSDLYALGVLMFEWLSGRPLYDAADLPGILMQIVYTDAPPLHTVCPTIPLNVSNFVARLLNKDPQSRPHSAEETAMDWRQTIASLGTEALNTLPRLDTPSQAPTELFEPAFVGREEQMDVLIKRLELLRQGISGVVFIGGESGVGKSRIAKELLRLGTMYGVGSFWSHCYEDTPVPFGAFLPMIRTAVQKNSPPQLVEMVERSRPLLASVVPEFSSFATRDTPVLPQDEAAEKYRLFDILAWCMAWLATPKPQIIVLDDMQWADARSLEFLSFLVRDLIGSIQPRSGRQFGGVLLMVTYREDEINRQHPLAQLMSSLEGSPAAQSIRLDRLTEDSVRRMIGSMLGGRTSLPERVLDRLIGETDGNAFFVGEFLKALMQEGALEMREGAWRMETNAITRFSTVDSRGVSVPLRVRDVIRRRLSKLSPAAVDTARLCAVAGREFPYALLLAAAQQPEADTLDRVEELLQARVLVEIRGRDALAFYHPQIREVVLEDMSEARRRALHLRLGEALEKRAGAQISAYLFDLAWHFAEGRDLARAADYLLRAAELAAAAHAYEKAQESLQQILSLAADAESSPLPPQLLQRVRERRADYLLLAGEFDMAIEAYDALRQELSGVARAAVLRKMGRAYDQVGRHDDAFKCFQDALALLGEKLGAARAQSLLSLVVQFAELPLVRIRDPKKSQTADDLGRLRELRRLYDQMVQSYYYTKVDDRRLYGLDLAMRQLRVSHNLGQPADLAQAYLMCGFLFMHLGPSRVREYARQYLEKALAYAKDAPESSLRARLLREAGYCYLMLGDLNTASGLLHESFEFSARMNDILGLVPNAVMLSIVLEQQADMDRATDMARLTLSKAMATNNVTQSIFAMARMASLAMERNDLVEAEDLLRRMGDTVRPEWSSDSLPVLSVATIRGEVQSALGDWEAGIATLESARAAHEKGGMSPYFQIRINVATGMAWLDWLEQGGQPLHCVERAGRIVRETRKLARGPLHCGMSLMLAGRWSAARGAFEESGRRFRRALVLLEEAGATLFLARCLVEASRTSHDPLLHHRAESLCRQHGLLLLLERLDQSVPPPDPTVLAELGSPDAEEESAVT